SIDGSGNNVANPTENQVGADFARVGPANFADGISTMLPTDPGAATDPSAVPNGLPNPRTVSDIVVAGPDQSTNSPQGLSDFMYAWGQFIDHNLDLESQTTATT